MEPIDYGGQLEEEVIEREQSRRQSDFQFKLITFLIINIQCVFVRNRAQMAECLQCEALCEFRGVAMEKKSPDYFTIKLQFSPLYVWLHHTIALSFPSIKTHVKVLYWG